MEIEVFRAGNPAATAAGITAADLADVAAFDCATHPVPNVIGHPKNDSPANGAVVKFRAEGNSLFADVPEKLPAFQKIVDGIKGSTILGRSMAFFGKNHPSNPTPGKIAPKHLGWLGGAAPGIPGMAPLSQAFAFSADDQLEVTGDPAPAIIFEAAPTAVLTFTEEPATPPAATQGTAMTPEEIKAAQDKLAADQAAHSREVAAFAATAKANREAGNVAAVQALVTAGKVAPADQADLVAAFNAVDDGEVIEFASDKAKASPVSRIVAIMTKGGKVAPVGDGQLTPTEGAPQFSASEGSAKAYQDAITERNARYGKSPAAQK